MRIDGGHQGVGRLGMAVAAWLGLTAAADAYQWDGAAWADNTAFMSPITQAVKDRCRAIRATTNGQSRTAGRMGQIGDSITYSSAYFIGPACPGPSANETGHDYLPIRQWLTGDANPDYNSWYFQLNGLEKRGKGPPYGCYSGWEISDAVTAGHPANCLDVGLNGIPGNYSWALIMYGTNDIDPPGWSPAAWRTAYSNFVQGFIAQGVIPVLSTIPPERAHVADGRVETANDVIRALAVAMDIPYVDYYALIKYHQPTTWDGTLIGPDGTHPSSGGAGSRDFSRMALTTNNGFTARSRLTLDLAEKLKAIVFDDSPAEGGPAVAPAGTWVGYEGALHQSSSPTDIAPPLTRLWDQRFTNKVTIPAASGWSGTNGNHSARNLTYYQGHLGLVASVANQTKQTANVAILDATSGAVLNCVSCDRELHGAYKNMWDATETAWGEHVAAWDPDTGILFLAIGGDMPSHTAILPLANRASYSGSVQTAIGAYATLATNFPDLRGGNDQRRDSTSAGNVRNGGALANDEWGEAQNLFANRTAMFDVQAGSSWLVLNRDLGHSSAAGSSLANKYTGLPAKKPYGDMSNPLDYDSTVTESGFPCFKNWGGILTATNRVYFMGPYESGVSPYDVKMKTSSRGLRVACMVMSNADVRVNGGYTGPGAAETAMPVSEVFDVGWDSTTTNINESWHQSGTTNEGWQRNKAWLVQGDGIWAAWKPSRTSAVELVRVTNTESNRYSLGVGTNMLYQDIWPNIAYTDCGTAGRYVVYYLANSFTGPADLGSTSTGVTNEWTPAGPASLTVFDASARTVRWTFELNNAARTGAYPDLPPNPAGCWYETSRLVVAGRYAHLAWVDTVGVGNARLKVATFDVAGHAPGAAPAPRAFDLGISKTGNGKSRVTDLIAVSNMLYVLVSEDNAIDRSGELNAQRVVALQAGNGYVATNPVAVMNVTPTSGSLPLLVSGDGSRSSDDDGTITNYVWNFSDGSAPTSGVLVSHLFTNSGSFSVALTVTDDDGNTATAQTVIRAGFVPHYVTNTVVVTGSNDTADVRDTFLYAPQPDNDGYRNLSEFAASSVTNDLRVPLLRFDLTNISVNAEVLSAVMTLYCFNVYNDDATVVYPMSKPWSWRYACYNYRDNATWWNSGDQPFDRVPPTTDYEAASGITNSEIYAFVPANWDLTRLASNWVVNPAANYGVTLIPVSANSETRFRSSNYTNEVGVQPRLVITYRVPAPPPTGLLLQVR
jgi:PKD repeat protein